MDEVIEGYRAFPSKVPHPREARLLGEEEFKSLDKLEIESAVSVCEGHLGSTIWYVKEIPGFIVDVHIVPDRHFYVESICTHKPTFGMDVVDGMFAQDVEEYILSQSLGFETDRLAVYGDMPSISTMEYVAERGVAVEPSKVPGKRLPRKKPWWRFW